MKKTTAILWVVNLILLFTLMIPSVSFGSDPCEEYKKIYRDRIRFDINMRKKRIELRKKLAEERLRDNGIETKMYQTEEKILATDNEEEEDNLWDKYIELGHSREELYAARHKVLKEYIDVSYKRPIGKMNMRIDDLENHYRCVVNNKLNGRLSKLAGQMEASGKYSEKQISEYKKLVSERDALIKDVKEKYEKYKLEAERFRGEVGRFTDLLIANEEMNDKLDNAQEEAYEDIYDIFDGWRKSLKDYSKQLAKKSEQLVHFLD